jgi:hypothetical protein
VKWEVHCIGIYSIIEVRKSLTSTIGSMSRDYSVNYKGANSNGLGMSCSKL